MVRVLLWAAGGGSSGFGGGGGGGYSGGGGSGSGGGSLPWPVWVLVGLVVLGSFALTAFTAWRLKQRRRERAARVTVASAEAAADDPQFAAEHVTREVAVLFARIQKDWSDDNRVRLREVVGSDLLVEWERRLDDFAGKGWRNVCTPRGAPSVGYVGLVNRVGEAEDRITVLIEATLDDYVQDSGGAVITRNGESSQAITLAEYWTLAQREDRWVLVSIEQAAEGDAHHLDAPIVTTPDADARIADETLVELASRDAAVGFTTAEIADLDLLDDARAAALDLSLADARFAPDVLEVAVRRAVAAWAEAVDGADEPLLAIASREAADALLHAGDGSLRTRVVVRGGRVARVTITGLAPAPEPARMTAEVEVHGVRYVEDRDTVAVISGSKAAASTWALHWTFALDGTDATPWRLVSSDSD